MEILTILAAFVISLTSPNPVTAKKMVFFGDGKKCAETVFAEPLVLTEQAVEVTFDVDAAPEKDFCVAVYEFDASKPEGIGRACSFVYGRSLRNTRLALKDNGERYDVKGRGFYKSLFVDAGYMLNNNYLPSHLQWIKTLGIEDDYEYFQCGKKDSVALVELQKGVMVSSPCGDAGWKDDNGALLYPDGQPRFRMIYANGGKSSKHGASLGDKGRYQIRDFYANGGSYVGTCAGAFLGCAKGRRGNRFDNSDPKVTNYTFGLFPGAFIGTGVPIDIKKYPSAYTAMTLSPRFKEIASGYGYSFADTIERVRHHGGGYLKDSDLEKYPGAEMLMRYAYSEQSPEDSCSYTELNRVSYRMYGKDSKLGPRKSIAGRISTFAWKENAASGRACITGSHPEKEPQGCTKHDLICLLARYAMDGNGDATVKGELSKGGSYSSKVGVGDLQYHHFRFTSDKDLENVKIVLDSKADADLYLTLRRGDFAWLSDADYMVCSEGGKKTLTVASLPAGEWYIGVYCATTVQASVESEKKNFNYFYYVDRCKVLGGVKYKLSIK